MLGPLLISLMLASSAPAEPSARAKAMAVMNQAVKSARHGNLEGAERGLLEATTVDPELDLAWLNLGVLRQQQGRLEDAAEAFEAGMKVGQARVLVELRFRLAVVTREQARAPGLSRKERQSIHEAALGHFDAVTRAEPSRSRAHLGKAQCLHALDRPDEADAAYRSAIEANPHLPEAYAGLGRLYGDYGFHRLAMAVLEVGVQVNDTSAQAWLGLGNGLVEAGRHEEAIDAYGKAKAIDPDLPEVLFRLGMAHAELRHRRESIEALNAFLGRAGNDVPEHLKKAANNTIARMQDVL